MPLANRLRLPVVRVARRFLKSERELIEDARDVSGMHPYIRARAQNLPFKYGESPPAWPALTQQEYWALHGDRPSEGIDASLCWPTVEEIDEYNEDAKYDLDIHQRFKIVADRELQQREERDMRQNKLLEGVRNLPKALADFKNRQRDEKKAEDSNEKERQQLLALAREHYGFKIDTSDERMRLMMADLEDEKRIEQKRQRKAERAKMAAEKLKKMLADVDESLSAE